jgi:Mn2+/Fe2+ NRAMP family transporter
LTVEQTPCGVEGSARDESFREKKASARARRWRRLIATLGPGLVVMLADNDAGSVITAAQSGAVWGYRLLLLQIVLVPVMFMTQELAARLGLGTGHSFGELVRQRFGRAMARIAMAALLISCFGALVTQMSGLAGVGVLFGVPIWQTMVLVVVFVLVMAWTSSYHAVERVAIAIGSFGLAFVLVAWKAQPDVHDVVAQLRQMPLGNPRYLYLLAANLGTSVMPWTVYYQQAALVDKGLGIGDLKAARGDTLAGILVCQLLAASMLIAAAATLGSKGQGVALDSVGQISVAFTATLGDTSGRIVFALGMGGCSLVALIVVCLSGAWAVGEGVGVRRSLEEHPRDAPWFYASLAAMLIGAATLVASGVNLVEVSIATGVVNALLVPLVLWLLYQLARTTLGASIRLRGGYRTAVAVVFLVTGAIGLYAAVMGIFGS